MQNKKRSDILQGGRDNKQRQRARSASIQEHIRLKSALSRQKHQDAVHNREMQKMERLSEHQAIIMKHMNARQSYGQSGISERLNDMTRTFNFAKNTVVHEFKNELCKADRMEFQKKKRYFQTNTLFDKFATAQGIGGKPLILDLKKEPGFVVPVLEKPKKK